MEEKKGRAAACQLCINSKLVCWDIHAHGMHERRRHAVTEAEKKTSPTFTTPCVWDMEYRVDLDRALLLI